MFANCRAGIRFLSLESGPAIGFADASSMCQQYYLQVMLQGWQNCSKQRHHADLHARPWRPSKSLRADSSAHLSCYERLNLHVHLPARFLTLLQKGLCPPLAQVAYLKFDRRSWSCLKFQQRFQGTVPVIDFEYAVPATWQAGFHERQSRAYRELGWY